MELLVSCGDETKPFGPLWEIFEWITSQDTHTRVTSGGVAQVCTWNQGRCCTGISHLLKVRNTNSSLITLKYFPGGNQVSFFSYEVNSESGFPFCQFNLLILFHYHNLYLSSNLHWAIGWGSEWVINSDCSMLILPKQVCSYSAKSTAHYPVKSSQKLWTGM